MGQGVVGVVVGGWAGNERATRYCSVVSAAARISAGVVMSDSVSGWPLHTSFPIRAYITLSGASLVCTGQCPQPDIHNN